MSPTTSPDKSATGNGGGETLVAGPACAAAARRLRPPRPADATGRARTPAGRRADLLARIVAPRSDEGETVHVLEFRLGAERYAVENAAVREVHVLREITPVPGTPDFILGVVIVRGRICSVVDLARVFDLPARERGAHARVVVLAERAMELGVVADEVVGMRAIATATFQDSLSGDDRSPPEVSARRDGRAHRGARRPPPAHREQDPGRARRRRERALVAVKTRETPNDRATPDDGTLMDQDDSEFLARLLATFRIEAETSTSRCSRTGFWSPNAIPAAITSPGGDPVSRGAQPERRRESRRKRRHRVGLSGDGERVRRLETLRDQPFDGPLRHPERGRRRPPRIECPRLRQPERGAGHDGPDRSSRSPWPKPARRPTRRPRLPPRRPLRDRRSAGRRLRGAARRRVRGVCAAADRCRAARGLRAAAHTRRRGGLRVRVRQSRRLPVATQAAPVTPPAPMPAQATPRAAANGRAAERPSVAEPRPGRDHPRLAEPVRRSSCCAPRSSSRSSSSCVSAPPS